VSPFKFNEKITHPASMCMHRPVTRRELELQEVLRNRYSHENGETNYKYVTCQVHVGELQN
jgi:hypothetical protein